MKQLDEINIFENFELYFFANDVIIKRNDKNKNNHINYII